MEYYIKEMMFDHQAIGLELIFYDSGSQYQRLQVIKRLIRAKVDTFSRFICGLLAPRSKGVIGKAESCIHR